MSSSNNIFLYFALPARLVSPAADTLWISGIFAAGVGVLPVAAACLGQRSKVLE
jgi:hypothetical protein